MNSHYKGLDVAGAAYNDTQCRSEWFAKRARANHERRCAVVCVREVSHRCNIVCWSLIFGLAVTVNVFVTETASARDMLRVRFASASHVTRSG